MQEIIKASKNYVRDYESIIQEADANPDNDWSFDMGDETYNVYDTEGDGNCYYYALQLVLLFEGYYVDDKFLRNLICDETLRLLNDCGNRSEYARLLLQNAVVDRKKEKLTVYEIVEEWRQDRSYIWAEVPALTALILKREVFIKSQNDDGNFIRALDMLFEADHLNIHYDSEPAIYLSFHSGHSRDLPSSFSRGNHFMAIIKSSVQLDNSLNQSFSKEYLLKCLYLVQKNVSSVNLHQQAMDCRTRIWQDYHIEPVNTEYLDPTLFNGAASLAITHSYLKVDANVTNRPTEESESDDSEPVIVWCTSHRPPEICQFWRQSSTPPI